MTPFLGLPGCAGARRKLLPDFMVLGKITRGRHTDNLGGCHSIQTNQQSISINPPIFMPDAFPAATIPNLSWLGTGTGICWIMPPWLGLA